LTDILHAICAIYVFECSSRGVVMWTVNYRTEIVASRKQILFTTRTADLC